MIIRRLEALFTLNTNAAAFKKATSQVDKLAHHAETAMKAIAGYWAFQAVQNLVTNSALAMAEIGKTAGYLGVAADALQELRFAAEKSGVSLDTLEDSLKEIQIRAVDAKSGTGEAAEAFAALGLKTTDAADRMRDPLELLYAVADHLKQLPSQSERIWVVDAIFGDQGAEMLKMMKDGSAGLQKMRNEAGNLGLVLGASALSNAEKFNQALTRLKVVTGGLSNTLVQGMMPILTGLIEISSTLLSEINKLLAHSSIIRVALISLGIVLTALLSKFGIMLSAMAIKMVIAFSPVLVPILGITAGVVALALVLEDLWIAFTGGQSVIKTFFIWLSGQFSKFSDWILNGFSTLASKAKNILSEMIPDFLKSGFSATIKTAQNVYSHIKPRELSPRMAPTSTTQFPQNLTSNQKVNVSVNVKSHSNPQAIGSEVSKAVRKEMERERFNAFIGVTQYAS